MQLRLFPKDKIKNLGEKGLLKDLIFLSATIADLNTAYTTGDLDTEAEVIAAINATNTAVNSILAVLKEQGLLRSA